MNSRHKGITKDEIMEKSLEMFLEKGYHGTSTAQICDSLGISKPTLYWHFKNKQELVFYAHKNLVNSLLRPILDKMEKCNEPLKRIEMFIEDYSRVICKNPVLRLLVQENAYLDATHSQWVVKHWKVLLKLLRKSLRQLQDEDRAKNLDDAFAAMNLIGMCTWPYYWFDYSRPEGIEQLIDNIKITFFNGILKQP
jgi:AcrR family transcriptional regulator